MVGVITLISTFVVDPPMILVFLKLLKPVPDIVLVNAIFCLSAFLTETDLPLCKPKAKLVCVLLGPEMTYVDSSVVISGTCDCLLVGNTPRSISPCMVLELGELAMVYLRVLHGDAIFCYIFRDNGLSCFFIDTFLLCRSVRLTFPPCSGSVKNLLFR